MIQRGRTIAGLVTLAVLIVGGGSGYPAGASALSQGQVVVAFGPELTGDPTTDTSRTVGTGDTVTVYFIVGSLPLPARHFGFGLGISESGNLKMGQVRSFGFAQVNAFQSDLETIVRVAVNVSPNCFDVGGESVLAEVDLVRVGDDVPVQIHLGHFLYETGSPPEMESCNGVVKSFDDSLALPLSVRSSVPTPIAGARWTTIKELYRSP